MVNDQKEGQDLVIVNALLVNEGECFVGELRVQGDRIAEVGSCVKKSNGAKILDANGKLVMPGMIDDQVHFREPGLIYKGSIETESKAAVAGGITSYMEMPNCNPPTTNNNELQKKHDIASQSSWANYGFYHGTTNDNLEDIKVVDPDLACGIKVFMGSSTGNMLVDDPKILEQVFRVAAIPITVHCEHNDTIVDNFKSAEKVYGDNIPMSMHPVIRSVEACYASSSYAVSLAKRYGTTLHVLHLTTEKEMALFSPNHPNITAEVCVHHLFFNDTWYQSKEGFVKCNPAIKSRNDQKALLQAVKEDVISVIATDHAPHLWHEKVGNYAEVAAGLPLVQHALIALLELFHSGDLSLEMIVEKVCHAPARLFHVHERGYLREGYFADLAIIDLHSTERSDDSPIYAKCGFSPFQHFCFRSKVETTIINGQIIYDNGHFMRKPIAKPLIYKR